MSFFEYLKLYTWYSYLEIFFSRVSNPSAWTQGGKNSLPNVGEHLTNRDHLEAIHDHLRYIYDRLDDLLDRIHVLESNQRNWNIFCAVDF